jgi:hypothetical protein
MGLFRKAIRDDFIVVAVSSGLTMEAENHAVMIEAILSSRPSHWELLNPYGYMIFFRSRKSESQDRAGGLVSNIQQLILTDSRFAEFKVGKSEGPLITEISWLGKILFPPGGEAATAAMKNQQGKEEMQNIRVNQTRD